jgi:hypothetical protein
VGCVLVVPLRARCGAPVSPAYAIRPINGGWFRLTSTNREILVAVAANLGLPAYGNVVRVEPLALWQLDVKGDEMPRAMVH